MTVVVPTLGRPTWLHRSISSALSQVGVNLEVVVVADGPSGGTEAAVLALGDPRVRFVSLPTRSGVSAARNAGIDQARGGWVAFLDDDDVWAPTKLRRQIEAAATVAADVVYTGVALLADDGTPSAVLPVPAVDGLECALRETNVLATPSCVMVRTSLVRQVGGFDTLLSVLADWDLWLQLVVSARVARCPEPLTGYTVHRGGMHLRGPRALRSELRYLRRKHQLVGGTDVGGYSFHEWLASSYRRAGKARAAGRAYIHLGLRYRRSRHLLRGLALVIGESFTRPLRSVSSVPPAPRTALPMAHGPELVALVDAARWA